MMFFFEYIYTHYLFISRNLFFRQNT